jgi:NADH:ubiquinone oxidoreductase subunit 2 (subunit N)
MLDGINVLNEVELMDTLYNKIWKNLASLFGCSLIVFLVLTTIFLVIDNYSNKDMYEIASISSLGLIASILLFIISCIAIIFTSKQVPTGEYEYQVTIDESVSMVNFTSKYDIIRVDGEIYTIREKESE